MRDAFLRQFVQTIEATGRPLPLTLFVQWGAFSGLAVPRAVYLERLEELAISAERVMVKTLARAASEKKVGAGAIVHLVESVFVAAINVEATLSSEDGRRVSPIRPPMRVRLRHVIGWLPGNLSVVAN